MSVNKVILVGNVGGDPQVRTVGDNKVANFTLATTERFKDKEETEWHNVAVWGKQAEIVERYVKKGSPLYIEGRIKTEKYTDKDGNDRYMVRIISSALQLLGKKDNDAPASAPAPAAPARPRTTPLPVAGDPEGDDLPFN